MKRFISKNQNIEFDYFAENQEDFYRKFSERSVLVQGEHWKKPPMVEILLPTCKRPKLLKQALESALNQVHFDDYQILVVDNEGAPLEQETETSKLIAQYSDPKIVYYRHERPVEHRMDSAVKLARSPWICFLHDDDLLSENHLSVLTRIVQKHKKIKFLTCPTRNFYNEISEEQFSKLLQKHKGTYRLVKYPGHYTCIGYFPGWLGALINRRCYINMGGMPSNNPGCGDYVMVGKFMYRYGFYQCSSSNALYFYRRWKGQLSGGGTDVWTRVLTNEYKYHKYLTQKYHKLFVDFWDRISAYKLLDMARKYNYDFSISIDIKKMIEDSGMPHDILDNGKRYERDMLFLSIYKYLVTGHSYTGWTEFSDKHFMLFLFMNQWVQVLQEGHSISSYLEKKQYKNIAIYGMSYAGTTLFQGLQRSKIEVKYGIDRVPKEFEGCKVIHPDEKLENVDAVIVTAVHSFAEIKKDLSKKMSCPIISLKEILDDLSS